MQIKVLKTIIGAENQAGTSIKEYKEGEVYEIFNELAQVFIDNKWGEEFIENIKNKTIEASPENKAFVENKKEQKQK